VGSSRDGPACQSSGNASLNPRAAADRGTPWLAELPGELQQLRLAVAAGSADQHREVSPDVAEALENLRSLVLKELSQPPPRTASPSPAKRKSTGNTKPGTAKPGTTTKRGSGGSTVSHPPPCTAPYVQLAARQRQPEPPNPFASAPPLPLPPAASDPPARAAQDSASSIGDVSECGGTSPSASSAGGGHPMQRQSSRRLAAQPPQGSSGRTTSSGGSSGKGSLGARWDARNLKGHSSAAEPSHSFVAQPGGLGLESTAHSDPTPGDTSKTSAATQDFYETPFSTATAPRQRSRVIWPTPSQGGGMYNFALPTAADPATRESTDAFPPATDAFSAAPRPLTDQLDAYDVYNRILGNPQPSVGDVSLYADFA